MKFLLIKKKKSVSLQKEMTTFSHTMGIHLRLVQRSRKFFNELDITLVKWQKVFVDINVHTWKHESIAG